MDFRNFKFWDNQRGAIGNLVVIFIGVWVLGLIPILERFCSSRIFPYAFQCFMVVFYWNHIARFGG